MTNPQLYIEIMRLGAGGGGREEQNDLSQWKFWVERKMANHRELPGDLQGDLSQASDRGKPQWLPERLYSREQKRAPMAPARLLCLLFTLQFRGRDNC